MKEKRDVLTRSFAEKRAKLISNVHYDIFISLKEKSKTYDGKCTINFNASKKDNVLIDTISTVNKVTLNGEEVNPKKDNVSMTLPKSKIKQGQNVVEISYEANYDHTGTGLHQFIDPEDNNEYYYSNFEPYSAHRMFPCFDQPDLKATYQLTTESPKNWISISNTDGKEKIEGGRKITTFQKTQKFSTYLFHLSAGPYDFFEDSYNAMRLRIYFRKDRKKYMPKKEIFKITKQGLAFYSEFFDFPYPFTKYDQIFVPEYNHGAMENVGAVTFNENLIPRREQTATERSRLADVILHEMAHMWFGDLVTMKWWDDLWLNESFADFLAYFSMANATEFKDAWQDFNARKNWAYHEDQLVTTHPIAANAPDTEIAFSNFDGISYAKGASVLKQLMFYIGEENFRNGIRNYFKKFQWQNTELKDFLSCLEGSSGKNLKPWFKTWIETTGVNEIVPEYKTDNGTISSFTIKQLPSKKNNLLREHKTKVLLISEGQSESFEVAYKGKSTNLKEPVGKKEPQFVFLNYEDHDYVKASLDKTSLDYSLNSLSKIENKLTRQMVYSSLWNMVRDAKLPPEEYLKLVIKNSPLETNLFILEIMFARASAVLELYLPDNKYQEYAEKLYVLAWNALMDKSVSKEHKSAWFSLFLTASPPVNSEENILSLLNGKTKIKGLELDQDKRWVLVLRMAIKSYNVEELIKKESKRDNSDKAKKFIVAIEAAQLQNKEKFWKLLTTKNDYSLDYLRSAMGTFFPRLQKNEMKKYIKLFFKEIENIYITKDRYYYKEFMESLFPHLYADEETINFTSGFIKKNKKLPALVKKHLRENLDILKMKHRAIKKFSKRS